MRRAVKCFAGASAASREGSTTRRVAPEELRERFAEDGHPIRPLRTEIASVPIKSVPTAIAIAAIRRAVMRSRTSRCDHQRSPCRHLTWPRRQEISPCRHETSPCAPGSHPCRDFAAPCCDERRQREPKDCLQRRGRGLGRPGTQPGEQARLLCAVHSPSCLLPTHFAIHESEMVGRSITLGYLRSASLREANATMPACGVPDDSRFSTHWHADGLLIAALAHSGLPETVGDDCFFKVVC